MSRIERIAMFVALEGISVTAGLGDLKRMSR